MSFVYGVCVCVCEGGVELMVINQNHTEYKSKQESLQEYCLFKQNSYFYQKIGSGIW